MKSYIKVLDENFSFAYYGCIGIDTEDVGEKMRWLEERLTRSLTAEVTARFNWLLVHADPGVYRVTVIVEKTPKD
jgi:hypothetical protein